MHPGEMRNDRTYVRTYGLLYEANLLLHAGGMLSHSRALATPIAPGPFSWLIDPPRKIRQDNRCRPRIMDSASPERFLFDFPLGADIAKKE